MKTRGRMDSENKGTKDEGPDKRKTNYSTSC